MLGKSVLTMDWPKDKFEIRIVEIFLVKLVFPSVLQVFVKLQHFMLLGSQTKRPFNNDV